MYRILVVGCLTCAMFTAGSVEAQDTKMMAKYGQGVHAYFAGDYAGSQELLTEVIGAGTKDSRPYYFRGLAAWRQGDDQSAEQDMQAGAWLEVTNDEPIFNINQALARVQGRERTRIEAYRRAARERIAAANKRARQVRYERLRRAEKDVLFDPEMKPGTLPVALEIPTAEPSNDPFLGGQIFATGTDMAAQTASNNLQATPPPRDPFGQPTTPTTPPAEPAEQDTFVDPFGGGNPPAAPPANDPFGGNAPATPPADPFGGNVPATPPANDPFGGNAPGAPPANNLPGNEPVTPPAADPFGAPGGMGGIDPVSGIMGVLGGLNDDQARDPFGDSQQPMAPPAGFPPGNPPAGRPPAGFPPAGEPPASNDPFGGGNAGEENGAAPQTPPDGNDPFGGGNDAPQTPPAGNDAPQTPPVGNDPFGGGNDAPQTPPQNDPFGN